MLKKADSLYGDFISFRKSYKGP